MRQMERQWMVGARALIRANRPYKIDGAVALAVWEASELGLDIDMLIEAFWLPARVIDEMLADVEQALVGAGEVSVWPQVIPH